MLTITLIGMLIYTDLIHSRNVSRDLKTFIDELLLIFAIEGERDKFLLVHHLSGMKR